MKWYNKEIWCNSEGWKYILINFLGNLFPIWFKMVIEFFKNGFTFSVIKVAFSDPFTYIVLSISLASMTIYLWAKKFNFVEKTETPAKSKTPVDMLIYILVFFPLMGFYISNETIIKENQNDNLIYPIYVISVFITIVYIYFQLRDFYELENLQKKSNSNPTKLVNDEVNDLNNQLNNL